MLNTLSNKKFRFRQVKDEKLGQFLKPCRLEPSLDQSKYFDLLVGKSSPKHVIPLRGVRGHPRFLTVCDNPNHDHI